MGAEPPYTLRGTNHCGLRHLWELVIEKGYR